MTLDDIITAIIDNEGRTYENVRHDRGGPTKFGITLGRLRTERGKNVTWEDVRDLTEDEARDIYKRAYWFRPKINLLPWQLQHAVVDFYVTSGTWAIKRLQRMLDQAGYPTIEDGVIGPGTLASAFAFCDAAPAHVVVNAYCEARADFYRRIVAGNPSQKKFLRGWLNRARKFVLAPGELPSRLSDDPIVIPPEKVVLPKVERVVVPEKKPEPVRARSVPHHVKPKAVDDSWINRVFNTE